MRFNAKELTCLACQSSDQFDKEGVLFVKERQEGLFRKGEGYLSYIWSASTIFLLKCIDIFPQICCRLYLLNAAADSARVCSLNWQLVATGHFLSAHLFAPVCCLHDIFGFCHQLTSYYSSITDFVLTAVTGVPWGELAGEGFKPPSPLNLENYLELCISKLYCPSSAPILSKS